MTLTPNVQQAFPFHVTLGLALLVFAAAPSAAVLHHETSAAFDRYVLETERTAAQTLTATSPRFLWVDDRGGDKRQRDPGSLRAGGILIEPLTTGPKGRSPDVPGGIIHHWIGIVFVPGRSVDDTLTVLQDYDRHEALYAPAVARSKLLHRDGETFHVALRFVMKKAITVVVNSEHVAQFARLSPTRAASRIVSSRIAEVDHPDTAQEHESPVGEGAGYLWRLNSYWRFLERDGGTYIQCESITLSRGIPLGLGWIVGPFVTSIPRESLAFTLEATRAALRQRAAASRED